MPVKLEDILKNLSIDESKIDEINKKPQVANNITAIAEYTPNFTKMHYSLACTAPKRTDLKRICGLIDAGLVKHENMLRGVYRYLEAPTAQPVEDFIRENDYSRAEIEEKIGAKLPMGKNDLLREMKKEMPYADFRIVVDIANERCTAPAEAAASKPAAEEDEYSWLDKGEITTLLRPEENMQATDEILREHLRQTGGKVVTRFPPEPNGKLHIGHAKAINLNFQYAKKYGGITYLRFDDTNPKNEKEEHYESIMEDVAWLGYTPYKITASSDYNDRMNEMSVELIKNGKAYVCHCSLDDIRSRRQTFQRERDAGNYDPTILSPYRNRSVEENLENFEKMLTGGFRDGEAVLRFKMDLDSKNPLMLDLVGSRVIDTVHPGKDKNWITYPTYEFALCVSDSLENVTHSFCSREFMTRQEPYHWLLKSLGLYEPVQWEFSRLNLSNTVLSKRKMSAIVKKGLSWDDPRLFTICGMRRRGFTAEAINKFVCSVGITYSETVVDVRILENFVRTDLNAIAKRVFCIKNPIKLTINNLTKRKVTVAEGDAPFSVDVCKTVYIDGSDFSESPTEDFYRLTKSQPVGLIGLGAVRFIEKSGDALVCELCDESPLKYVQWLANLNNKVELRLYEPLFKSFNPDQVGFMEDIVLDSCKIVDGYCDARISGAKALDKFQFIRMGFFCCDKDTTEALPVFNLTLPLKNFY